MLQLHIPDFPYTTDGCSGGMSALWRLACGTPPPWEQRCIEHDRSYWRGGTACDRRRADAILLSQVARKGYPVVAIIMWSAVRLGGHPLLPFPWRWGYGWKYPRKYER